MKPHWKTVACALLSMSMAAGPAQASGPARPPAPEKAGAALDHELQAIVDDPVLGMASLSVLAVRDGKFAYQGQFGHRYLHPSDPALNKPVTPDTLFRIASVSKFVTALGVMRLVEEGRLDLDRDIGDYLGYPLRNPAFPQQALSLRMLLSHTSSLRDGAGYSWGPSVSLRTAIGDKAGAWDPQRPPGTWFAYSNLNWGVIGTVMEAATGERFDLLMQRLVLAPLGLEGGFHVAALRPATVANIATLYRKRVSDSVPWDPAGPWVAQVDDYSKAPPASPAGLDSYRIGSNGSVFSPTGGLRISAADLGKIMLMLLDQGRADGRQFLRPATIASMFSTQWRFDPGAPNGDTAHGLFTSWGLGVQHFGHGRRDGSNLVPDEGVKASGHLGEAFGLLSVFALDFSQRSGVVVLIGGTARDPETTPGVYSSLTRYEEQVLSSLYRRVLRPAASTN